MERRRLVAIRQTTPPFSFSGCLNPKRQPEKTKPLGIEPNGFLLDRLAFRLPNPTRLFDAAALPLRPAERSILFSGKSVRLSDGARSATSSHAPKKGCSLREVWRSQTCTSGSPFFCQNLYSLSARADFVFSEYEYKATRQVNSETISLAWQRSRRIQ